MAFANFAPKFIEAIDMSALVPRLAGSNSWALAVFAGVAAFMYKVGRGKWLKG